jgi:hypothetical protein
MHCTTPPFNHPHSPPTKRLRVKRSQDKAAAAGVTGVRHLAHPIVRTWTGDTPACTVRRRSSTDGTRGATGGRRDCTECDALAGVHTCDWVAGYAPLCTARIPPANGGSGVTHMAQKSTQTKGMCRRPLPQTTMVHTQFHTCMYLESAPRAHLKTTAAF